MNPEKLIKPDSILSRAEAGSKKHALQMLGKLLAAATKTLPSDDVFLALNERERLGCTALAKGLAIPHARMAHVDEPVAAFIQLVEPIEFDAADDTPVDLIFGLLLPADYENRDAFKDLVQLLAQASNQARLRAADSADELHTALGQLEMPLTDDGPLAETPTDDSAEATG